MTPDKKDAFVSKSDIAWDLLPRPYRQIFEQEDFASGLNTRIGQLLEKEKQEKVRGAIRKLVFACMGLSPLSAEDQAIVDSVLGQEPEDNTHA